MFKDLVLKNRSYRRFYENEKIEYDILADLVDCARNTAASVNFQVLKYKLVNDETNNKKVFDCLAWAGLLKEWKGPEEGERPSAYVVILCDTSISTSKPIDTGIAAQTILLAATEKGYGGCMFGSINRSKLADELDIDPERYSIELVIALGKPKETVEIVEVPESGSTAYYRDENGVHYVPKRSLNEIII
ncbi:MAG: nitroreductase family protein [Acutalibacteraceae bacterium]|nr:nitroreductase family protein [Acutalibacteraceae bacterium]